SITGNKLKELKLSDSGSIEEFALYDTQIESLNTKCLSKNIEELMVSNNKLTNLDISKFKELKTIHCSNNNLTSFDVSKLPNLSNLDYSDNNIK
ncbi:hypothetical protein RFZ01_15645, partial [Acinetobacter pittii]|uniref:leucine-rich repeat domain-containing protein n=1 Tax=Acinetobacter pittii TaxID=48296 RepID=UPI0028148E2C|nr:hypothetical protein [Acinetobacter pittii]